MDYQNKAVVYKIINLVNAKFYIGSTIKIKERFRKHRRELRANKHHCPHLQAAWNKYGEDNFLFKIVEVVEGGRLLHEAEQRLLDEHHGKEHCYNLARYTDNSNRGVPLREDHRRAISVALKERAKIYPSPNLGRKHSTEAKALMSTNRAGKKVSEETKEKLRQANLGKKASEETKALLSTQRKGRMRSADHAAKYNKAIKEMTSGEIFPSLKAVKERFGMSPGMLAKALAADKPITKGKNIGLHFKYC